MTDVLDTLGDDLRRSYEAVDWGATAVGTPPAWSPALRCAVDLVLRTRFPATLLWGPELTLVYNEAYVPLIADKHPAALGSPARAVFPEAWDTIGPMLQSVLAGEGATWVEDAPVPLLRRGHLREAYFTFSYSPVLGADGTVAGVLDIASETTQQLVDRRRLAMLDRLREVLGGLDRVEDVPERALAVLRENADDLPEVAIEPAAGHGAGRPPGPRDERDVVVEHTPAGRVARLPLGRDPGGEGGLVLVVRLSAHHVPDDDHLGLLRLTAASLRQALDRIRAREAERGLSEALQRSLLPTPIQPDHVQVAVRYLPAAEQAEVGGDWYDAFVGPDGELQIVVGDVAGHDQRAAATMAQVRNLLRGVSHATQRTPARVLSALDEAMHGLAVGAFATAVLAQVEQPEPAAARGTRTLRWSNAGHPPPILLAPDGRARLLTTPPDLVLGLGDGERHDHAVELEPGTSVVLYSDGLVERRRVPLDDRMAWLTEIVDGRHELNAEELCDHVLAQVDGTAEDDVALLVLRVFPEDAPRPPEAGPRVLPADLRGDDAPA